MKIGACFFKLRCLIKHSFLRPPEVVRVRERERKNKEGRGPEVIHYTAYTTTLLHCFPLFLFLAFSPLHRRYSAAEDPAGTLLAVSGVCSAKSKQEEVEWKLPEQLRCAASPMCG